MRGQQEHLQRENDSQGDPEWVSHSIDTGVGAAGSQGPELKRASSQSKHPSLSKMSQNTRESMGIISQGLKQLFQQQRKRFSLSRSTITSSSSSLWSTGAAFLSAPENASVTCCPDSDPICAPVVPSAAGQVSAAVGIMRRGTSLQSRRSKGSGLGTGSEDRDPLLRGSPQAQHRRNTHDPQQHTSRPRSSSTTDTTPSSPAPGYASSDVVLSSGYQSTEETDRVSYACYEYTGGHWFIYFFLYRCQALFVIINYQSLWTQEVCVFFFCMAIIPIWGQVTMVPRLYVLIYANMQGTELLTFLYVTCSTECDTILYF